MSYELHPLYSTNKAFNGDVITSDEEKYMGRLYILATEDSKLLNLGINKEWFLAHALGDVLICGHINHQGEWSLSPYRSLEPTFTYSTRNQIFDQIFSPEYVWEISHLRDERTLNISQFTNNSDAFGSNDDDSDILNEKSATKIVEQLSINVPNIDILRNVILHSSPDDILSLHEKEKISEQSNQITSAEQEESIVNTMLPGIIISTQNEQKNKLEETQLLEIEKIIINTIIENYQEQETSEFILSPFGTVTIYLEEDYLILRSSESGHTIIAATLDGDIIDELKEVDALKFTDVLQQSKLEFSKQFEYFTQRQTIDLQTQNTVINQQKEIDYGT